MHQIIVTTSRGETWAYACKSELTADQTAKWFAEAGHKAEHHPCDFADLIPGSEFVEPGKTGLVFCGPVPTPQA